jgi:hypothetical protein
MLFLDDKLRNPTANNKNTELIMAIKGLLGPEDKYRYVFLSAVCGYAIVTQKQLTAFQTGVLISAIRSHHDICESIGAKLAGAIQSHALFRAQEYFDVHIPLQSGVCDMLPADR